MFKRDDSLTPTILISASAITMTIPTMLLVGQVLKTGKKNQI
jgi:hypothetical protein